MMKLPAIASSVLLVGALVAPGLTVASVEGGDCTRGHHKGKRFAEMADKLELTEGQRAQLKANREATRESRRDRRRQTSALRRELRKAITSGAEQSTLDSLGAQMGALQVARAQARNLLQQQFRAILTDEQKATLMQWKAKRKAHHLSRARSST